ncbi:hypothetical protein C8R44DRAFT_951616 [Mycena epipterygia]|nr:hypothetical protein C8R44DRAFT_951616 [Mycena epipterygia]
MLPRHSSLSLLALLTCISTIFASPIHNSLHRRDQEKVLIGYRYVTEDKAAEYNRYGTLTAIWASGKQLGEGAYMSPDINEWSVPSTYWQCVILADESKFEQVPKMYVPKSSNAWWNGARRKSFIERLNLNYEATVLFSEIDGDLGHMQMRIPPYYLRRSPEFHGPYGSGDLGIRVICVPKSEQNTNYFGNAKWGRNWNIPGWNCDLSRKRDGTDSCPLPPSPVGPILVPETLIPSPSGNISTVSSYSFTETPLTATSTNLPSVPPPVSGVSTGSIVFVSSSAFSFPAPIPTTSSASGLASSSSQSASAVSSASGHSSAATSSSAGASSAKSGASSHSASSSSSKPASTSKSASSVHSTAASTSAKSSAGKSSTVRTTSSAKPTTSKTTTTKAATTKATITTKTATTPKPKGGH